MYSSIITDLKKSATPIFYEKSIFSRLGVEPSQFIIFSGSKPN